METKDRSDNTGIFGAGDMARALPEQRIPENSMRAEDACELIQEELMLDGNARQNLATFCQTWNDKQVHRLMDICLSKNMIDKDEYPQCAEIEQRCVRMIADLWHAPLSENPVGCSTVGSSEACMLGGLAALRRWQARRRAQGLPTNRPNLVCGPVQICWHKFCRYWDIEKREVPMAPGRYAMNAEEMLKLVDDNTICVVPTFGLTHSGLYEFPEEICKALDQLAAQGGPDVDVHVDAASGGFLAPFCAPLLRFDFRLPRVKSISTSGHKYGLTPLGCGWVIWRGKQELPQELTFAVNYLGGSIPTIALNFSRPAGQVIAQYYNLISLGREGYRRVQDAAYQVAAWLAKNLDKTGYFDFIAMGNPQQGIPAVSCYLKPGVRAPFDLYDLSKQLRQRGWQIPAFALPSPMENLVIMRIMVRRGVTMDMASLLLKDIHRIIDAPADGTEEHTRAPFHHI